MRQNYMTTMEALLAQSARAVNGAQGVGVELLQTNTAGAVGADRTALVTAYNAHHAGKDAEAKALATLRTVINKARGFEKTLRDLLEQKLGTRPSVEWKTVGFQQNSLRIPRSYLAVIVLLERMTSYLTSHPEARVPQLNLTPEFARALAAEAKAAHGQLNLRRAAVVDLMKVRKKAEVRLRKRMRALLEELRLQLDPLDGRWLAFGFNQPGAKKVPPPPENVTVKMISATCAQMDWGKADRAEHYRTGNGWLGWMRIS